MICTNYTNFLCLPPSIAVLSSAVKVENGKTAKLEWTIPEENKENDLSVYIGVDKMVSIIHGKDPTTTAGAEYKYQGRLSAKKLESNTGVVITITKVKNSDEATFELVADVMAY